jgi:cyclophilin family peptidyl-prolyl cis-trans isomerase
MISLKIVGLYFIVLGGVASSGVRAANPIVIMETSMGTIKIELFDDKAPITVKNFLSYVEDKHYDGVIFHRVIPDFMIQSGGMEPGLKEKKTKDPIKNEAGNQLPNTRYTIAMARLNDPDTATSQFYINLKHNKSLDRANDPKGFGYCVFGRVIDGTDVVDKINGVKTGSKRDPQGMVHGDVPVEDVVIKSVRLQMAK